MGIELVAWDFDGVLNRDLENGEFIWHRDFERDLGVPLDGFREYIFQSGRFAPVLTGKVALRDVVGAWISEAGHDLAPKQLLDYWFLKSDNPDPDLVALMQALPQRQIIATNNEALRTAYIREVAGWGRRVHEVFASGVMGVAKPDAGFFAAIEDWAGCAPGEILLVDDGAANIDAAKGRGWQVYHFTQESRAELWNVFGLEKQRH